MDIEPSTQEAETTGAELPAVRGKGFVPFRMERLSPKVAIVGIGAILAIVLACVSFSAPSSFPKGGIVTVAPGDSLKHVSSTLVSEHYVRSQMLFVTFITLFGGERHLSQGDYYFAQPKGVVGVAWQIARGHHDLDPVKVTIPEGRDVTEISAILAEKLPGFDSATFASGAKQYEGYLFPDTYFLYPKTDPASVISDMRSMWTSRTAQVLTKKNLAGRSEKDVVIMASLIEREARGSDDRAMISGILWNRISRGMVLQVDATVAFALDIPEAQVTKADLGVDSPYNTYLYRGLPPGPIANPGIAALTAAMNPTPTDYLYYLHDSKGGIHYAKTYAEHQANVAKYLK